MDLNSLIQILIFTHLSFGSLLLFILMKVTSNPRSAGEDEKEDRDLAQQTKEKSMNILYRATQKANTILANAELRGIKLFAKEKLDSRSVTENYHKRIGELEEQFTRRFETRVAESEKSYKEFLNYIEKTLQSHVEENQKKLEDQSIVMMNQSQTTLDSSVQKVESQVKEQLDKELAGAKLEIETYKNKRLQILDQNIVEILEKTLSVTLGKKLSLTDQSDLIYQALEEAKNEHALP